MLFVVYLQNSEFSETNKTLTNNISSLFNTAKLEIERKDNEIKELRQTQIPSSSGRQQGSRPASDREHGAQHAQQERSQSRGRDQREQDRKREYSPREERQRDDSRDLRGSGQGGRREERSSEREREKRRRDCNQLPDSLLSTH